ncbi:hypothetical protein E1B28_013215 [Marasmius oreades]|uniref:Uncharacterized protein n=1 Tax=Marasmius oreades TaxID=181124 RepID=A0A9P7RP97_9AGAR|nr:uncharacterized protein E1B28_013215 [Marasmius oreades]KAG7087234.1 hypothetical protein E1B28_013215 [Marasmius oreades]
MISTPSDSTPRSSRPVLLRAIARSVSLRDGDRKTSPHPRKTLSSLSLTDLLSTSLADSPGACGSPDIKEDRNEMFKRKPSLVKKPGFNSAESAVPIKPGKQDSLLKRISSLVRRDSTRESSPRPSSSQTLSSDPTVSSGTTIEVGRDWDRRGDLHRHDSEGLLNNHLQALTELDEEPFSPLPTPCQGLFESSSFYSAGRSHPSSSKLMIVVDHASAKDPLLPASLGQEFTHDLAVPFPLSPLLSPIIGQTSQISLFDYETPSSWNIALPPSPILSPSPSMSTQDIHTYLEVELDSALRGHSHSRRLSRSRSASESDESSSGIASVDTLSALSLEYALNVSGCKLKDSARPKTWASDRGYEIGVRGLVIPTEKHIMPSTAIIVGLHRQRSADGVEIPIGVKRIRYTEESTSDDGVAPLSAELDVSLERKPISQSYPVGVQLPSLEAMKERNARRKSATFFDRFRRVRWFS